MRRRPLLVTDAPRQTSPTAHALRSGFVRRVSGWGWGLRGQGSEPFGCSMLVNWQALPPDFSGWSERSSSVTSLVVNPWRKSTASGPSSWMKPRSRRATPGAPALSSSDMLRAWCRSTARARSCIGAARPAARSISGRSLAQVCDADRATVVSLAEGPAGQLAWVAASRAGGGAGRQHSGRPRPAARAPAAPSRCPARAAPPALRHPAPPAPARGCARGSVL